MTPTTDLYKLTRHLIDSCVPYRVYDARIFSFANGSLATNVCIGVLPYTQGH